MENQLIVPMEADPAPYNRPEQPDRFLDTAVRASEDGFIEAWERAKVAGSRQGVAGLFPEPTGALHRAYQNAIGYVADMGLAGLEAADAAMKFALGAATEFVPGQDARQEMRLTRDLYGMTEASMGNPIGASRVADDMAEQMRLAMGNTGRSIPRVQEETTRSLPAPERPLLLEDLREPNLDTQTQEAIPMPAPERPLLLERSRDTEGEIDPLDEDYILEDEDGLDVDNYVAGQDDLDDLLALENWEPVAEPTPPENPYTPEIPQPQQPTIFKSEIPTFIENLPFPAKGIKGQQLIKAIQDNPRIRNSEWESMDIQIDPQKKYSKDEVLRLVNENYWDVEVDVTRGYENFQRQTLNFNQNGYSEYGPDYFEVTVNATNMSPDSRQFLPKKLHFYPETLSHARATTYEHRNLGRFTIVEELQSDLLQNGYILQSESIFPKPGAPYNSFKEYFDETLTRLPTRPTSVNRESVYKAFDSLESEVAGLGYYLPLNTSASRFINHMRNSLRNDKYDVFDDEVDATELEKFIESFERYKKNFILILEQLRQEELSPVKYRKPPIKKTEEGVRLGLEALMSESAKRGVTKIVIPPFERIVSKRETEDGIEGVLRNLEPKSGFYATYVNALNTVLKKLKREYGDSFKVYTEDLDIYKDNDWDLELEEALGRGLSTTSTIIDFTELAKEKDLTELRFNKGGLATEREQMQDIFQRGGMPQSSEPVDPVSGNEVPTGSTPKEVRDDIPARLSEGEYVIPADVVRYLGLDRIEKLVQNAKKGLKEMEANGRIGGEVEDEEDDDFPFSEDELMAEDDMGGEGPMAFAEGGAVPFNRQYFSMGQSGQGFESREYINPQTKEKRTIHFVNGQPLGVIPQGFVPFTKEIAQQPTTVQTPSDTKVQSTRVTEDNGGSDRQAQRKETGQSNSGQSWADKNFEAISKDPEQFVKDALNPQLIDRVAVGGATVMAGPLAGIATKEAIKLEGIAAANAAMMDAQARGLPIDSMQEEIKNAVNSLSPVGQLTYKAGIAGTGKNYAEALSQRREGEGNATSVGTGGNTRGSTSTSSGSSSTPSNSTSSVGTSGFDTGVAGFGGSTSEWSGGSSQGGSAGLGFGDTSPDTEKTNTGLSGAGGRGLSFKKGGLVTRKTKPKTQRKTVKLVAR